MAEETGQKYFLDPHETQVSGAGETRCPCVKRSPLRFFLYDIIKLSPYFLLGTGILNFPYVRYVAPYDDIHESG